MTSNQLSGTLRGGSKVTGLDCFGTAMMGCKLGLMNKGTVVARETYRLSNMLKFEMESFYSAVRQLFSGFMYHMDIFTAHAIPGIDWPRIISSYWPSHQSLQGLSPQRFCQVSSSNLRPKAC